MSPTPGIELIEHDGFTETYDEIGDEDDCRAIELALMNIRHSPYDSHFLQADYEGYRDVFAGNYRIVFVICAECIGNGYVDRIDCADCEEIHGENQRDPQSVIKLIHLEDVIPKHRAS